MKKPKVKKVSQKRFDRLSKRADKSDTDGLVSEGSVVGKYSKGKKVKLKKLFTPKGRISEVKSPEKEINNAGMQKRWTYDSAKSLSKFPQHQLETKMQQPSFGSKKLFSSPISKRTPMQSKYGGSLLPEVTITAPAHKSRGQEIKGEKIGRKKKVEKISKQKEIKVRAKSKSEPKSGPRYDLGNEKTIMGR
jgi:hypothetical protein